MIRLFIIEDHCAIIVSGFKRMFYSARDGIEVTGSAKTVEDTIRSADPRNFDIFILDLWLANRQPVENIRNLKSHFPDKPVIIYTAELSLVWRKKMLEENAMAYITKNALRGEIKKAIETVAAGIAYYPVNLQDEKEKKVKLQVGNEVLVLKPMEQEILGMLAHGQNHKEIAEIAGISRASLEGILKKMRVIYHARNNIELVNILTRSGISL